MRAITICISTGINAGNSFKKHMHARWKKNKSFGILCKWSNCQKNANRFKCVFLIEIWENTSGQLT